MFSWLLANSFDVVSSEGENYIVNDVSIYNTDMNYQHICNNEVSSEGENYIVNDVSIYIFESYRYECVNMYVCNIQTHI